MWSIFLTWVLYSTKAWKACCLVTVVKFSLENQCYGEGFSQQSIVCFHVSCLVKNIRSTLYELRKQVIDYEAMSDLSGHSDTIWQLNLIIFHTLYSNSLWGFLHCSFWHSLYVSYHDCLFFSFFMLYLYPFKSETKRTDLVSCVTLWIALNVKGVL